MKIDLDQLAAIRERTAQSAFRLETLQQYLVPQEEARFAAFRAGHPMAPRTLDNSPWLQRLRADTARGFRWYKVHIVDNPLSDYILFELNSYLESQAVGQETFIADREDHGELTDLHEDFWLYDEDTAIRMVYDPDGRFLYPETVDDVTPYVEIRDTALRCAMPLDTYLARKGISFVHDERRG